MPKTVIPDKNEQQLRFITDLLDTDTLLSIQNLITALHPAEIAHLLGSLKPNDRKRVWNLVPSKLVGEVLIELNDEVRNGLIKATDAVALIDGTEALESDDLVDLLKDFPEVILNKVLESMNLQDRSRVESVLSYDNDSAGGLMSLDVLTIRANVNIDVVFRYLRMRGEIPTATDKLLVVNRDDHFLGVLPLAILLTSDTQEKIQNLMLTNVYAIPVDMPTTEVAILFERQDLLSAPVINEAGVLLGRITIDDVVDVIRDETDHSLMSMAGLDEEQDMFAPVLLSAERRAVWLGVNLFTALLASWVISLFEVTLDKVVALAILMPIVASMGGIAGSQTLTLVIRGLALHQIGKANAKIFLLKELAVGLINGILWAFVVAVLAGLWFNNANLGYLIGVALMINLICAAFAGATIPLLLQKIGVDPALAGGVLLTAVTDIIGFVAFLGLATLYFL